LFEENEKNKEELITSNKNLKDNMKEIKASIEKKTARINYKENNNENSITKIKKRIVIN